MPIYNLRCSGCQAERTRFAANSADARAKPCERCGAVMGRAATGPGARKVEVLDNGLMGRSVERLADAEELQEKRARESDPLAGGASRPARD